MKHKKIIRALTLVLALTLVCCVPAFAAGDVASAVESTWKDAAAQIKTVVDNVVFPALDMILAIAFFTKLAMAYFDYRKHGQFEWTGPVILFALFWRRANRWGALAGMISGGAMVFIWKFGVAKLGGVFAIYELLPAFIISAVVIVIVSLLTPAPEAEIVEEFESIGK